MNAIVMALIVLGVLAAGFFIVRRVRSKYLAERERKLKIAQGDFSDEAQPVKPAAAPKRKKRVRRWWRPKNAKPYMTQKEVNALFRNVPAAVEKVLQTRHECHATHAALLVADRELIFAGRAFDVISLPQRPDRADMTAWIAAAVDTCFRLRSCQRKVYETERRFMALTKQLEDEKEAIEQLLKLDKYDISDLPEEADVMFELARTARWNSQAPALGREETQLYFEPQPEFVDAVVEERLQSIHDAVAEMMAKYGECHTVHTQACSESNKLVELKKGPKDLKDPAKPNEQEVQKLLTGTFEWVALVQSQENLLREIHDVTVAALRDTRTAFDAARAEQGELARVTPLQGLTDLQWSRRDAAARICHLMSMRLDYLDKAPRVWASTLSLAPVSTKLREEERAPLEVLNTLMRKLGFAVAQAANADAKLAELQAEPVPPQAEEPSFTDASVEAFVRGHQKWSADRARGKTAGEQRAQRGRELQEQLKQRLAQVTESRRALGDAIKRMVATGAGHFAEVDPVLRAARYLEQRYTRY